jgi:hypothetical protein
MESGETRSILTQLEDWTRNQWIQLPASILSNKLNILVTCFLFAHIYLYSQVNYDATQIWD